jgi:Protein of unknown function (DUF3667)
MHNELEAAGADALGGFFRRKPEHSLPVGTPCPNCQTPLQGAWCHACGQKGEEFNRSIGHLIAEAFEGLTHFDGRVWQTMPRLLRDPGRLTRDYLIGKRAPQIPPFRLFLIVLVLVFFAGGLNLGHGKVNIAAPGSAQERKALAEAGVDPAKVQAMRAHENAFARWAQERATHNPEAVIQGMEHWAHRFAILMLPISALLLGLLFVFNKQFLIFDHLIFSMHSLSFQGLLISLVMLLGFMGDWALLLLPLAPLHLFVHMRGAYGTTVIGTLGRMALLFVGSLVAFMVLLSGLVFVGLATAH